MQTVPTNCFSYDTMHKKDFEVHGRKKGPWMGVENGNAKKEKARKMEQQQQQNRAHDKCENSDLNRLMEEILQLFSRGAALHFQSSAHRPLNPKLNIGPRLLELQDFVPCTGFVKSISSQC